MYTSNFAWLQYPCACLSLHDLSLQVNIHMHLIMVSKFARWCPPSESPKSLHFILQVCTILASIWSSALTLSQPRSAATNFSIAASKYMFRLSPQLPPGTSLSHLDLWLIVLLGTYWVMAFICLSELARSWPHSTYCCSHHHGHPGHCCIYMIDIFRCSSECSQVPSATSLAICNIYINICGWYML